MKKFILTSSVFCLAFALKADLVLCWAAPDVDSTYARTWYGAQTLISDATDLAGNRLGSVTYAKLGYFSDGNNYDAYYQGDAFRDNTAYAKGVDASYQATSLDSSITLTEQGWSQNGAAVVSGDYYYYIALFNATDQLVAYSQTFNASSAQSSVIDPTNFESFANFSGAYMGSGYAVPEPTSGLLVLLGMAGLALRRRKIA